MPEATAVAAARAKLMAKGGAKKAGNVRRARKAPAAKAGNDDKRLQTTLKRLGTNNIPGIDEVNMFKEDGTIMHFKQPKVQAAFQSNTYVVNGTAEDKSMQELLPGILSQMGPESLQYLQKMAGLAGANAAAGAGDAGEEDLQVDFEAAGASEEKAE